MKHLQNRIGKIIIVFCIIFALSAYANEQNPSQSKITQIMQRITHLKNTLLHDKNSRNNMQTNLQQVETTIAQLSIGLKQTKIQLANQQATLQSLVKKEVLGEHVLNQQRDILAAQMRAAYIAGHEQYLKMMLTQNHPEKIERLLAYYRYFVADRVKLMSTLDNNLQQLEKNRQAIEKQTQNLTALQVQQQQQQEQLATTRADRQTLLGNLDQEIAGKKQQLEILIANKQALEKVVQTLNTTAIAYEAPESSLFASLRGKLFWPTRGKIVEGFGTQIQSELKLSAVIIGAPQGQNVYTVASGRVVYAGWLSGYGLLMIINHGQGYMSLYGRNEVLYKKVGDTVKGGELISSVGQSGGYDKSTLYFAIRKDGKAINPSRWCTRQIPSKRTSA